MFPFNRSVTPAAKTHLEAQLSFFNDMSKSLFRSVQQYTDLNIQLAQTLLEESTTASHQMITADQATDVFNAAASRAQPTAGKMRAYQQHLSRLAADTQVDLANVAEEHVSETSRTAKALAEEVARVTSEETEKSLRNQQDTMRQFSDPFAQFANGAHRQTRGNEMRGSENLQSASGQGNHSGMESGSMQSGSTQGSQGAGMHSSNTAQSGAASQSAASKQTGASSRKEQ